MKGEGENNIGNQIVVPATMIITVFFIRVD